MITRSSIAFEDFLGSSIAPQVMPPCHSIKVIFEALGFWSLKHVCRVQTSDGIFALLEDFHCFTSACVTSFLCSDPIPTMLLAIFLPVFLAVFFTRPLAPKLWMFM